MNDKKPLNYINKEFIIISTFVGLSKIWSQYGFHLSYMLDISTIYLIKSLCTHAINTRYLQLYIHIFLLQTFKNNP